jgi:hypothetical protein
MSRFGRYGNGNENLRKKVKRIVRVVIEESNRDDGISKSSVPGMPLSFSSESDL